MMFSVRWLLLVWAKVYRSVPWFSVLGVMAAVCMWL